YTAGLMDIADRARDAGDPNAEAHAATARAAILELWQHRSAWPSGWPPARAVAIVRALDTLPDLEDPVRFSPNTNLSRLQNLHRHVLALLTDLAAAPGDGVEDGWLRTFRHQLTPDELTLLNRAASAPRRLDALLRQSEPVTSRLKRRTALGEPDLDAGKDDDAQPDRDEQATVDDDSLPTHPLLQLADAYRDTVLNLLDLARPANTSAEDLNVTGQHADTSDAADGAE
ncbi:MAG: hypothetical protein WCA46_19400, partial [Actinocatenispora sp.]